MPTMASRSGSRRRSMNEINMVPFIDVMLVLLIIFMVTAPMLTPGVVDVPKVGKGAKPPKEFGQVVVLKDGAGIVESQLLVDLVASVREEIGALACFNQVRLVKRLPKTRSGKILRAVLRKIADGQAYTPPSTVDDPAVLQEIEAVLSGLARAS